MNVVKITKVAKNKKKKENTNFVIWRFNLLCGGILLALAWLLICIAYLQIISPEKLVQESDMRSLRIQEVFTTRGMISDREGRKLAVSIPVNAIWADPKVVCKKNSFSSNKYWKALADALQIPLKEIHKKILANQKSRFVYLARQVTPTISEYISKLKIPGIYLSKESRRYYPSGSVTAHLIGITNIDGDGIEGIETSFDRWLKGSPGERTVRKDRNGKVIETVTSIDSQAANNLVLSIDERIQSNVYRELTKGVIKNKAESGVAIVVDVATGEILAMANSPSYNPNNLAGTPIDSMRNRAITDIFEPGSTVKPIVIITALYNHIVEEHTLLNTTPYRVNGHKITDVSHYSKLSITGILQKSSNVGVSKLALAMPAKTLVNAYSRFGFGQPTNLGLVGESSGIFPSKKIQWSNLDKATFSFGYGQMVTPLQLARAYATIGSFGIYRPLSITKIDPPVPGTRVFPKKIIQTVVHMMESVTLPGGGGVRAAIKGYRIAVKTGTAKKVGAEGKYINQYIAYTVGIAPASNPRYSLVVLINDPKTGQYYGGTVSAPIFSAIMGDILRIMNIKPDALQNTNKTS
ncbi:Peptidoglycan D,D-transpeptidase FtsI [Candidatus Hartigia pinicola]|nr:Peptidoglycan D,D-transpeptidase FtsI [Candidatus Hartigia pinicola]